MQCLNLPMYYTQGIVDAVSCRSQFLYYHFNWYFAMSVSLLHNTQFPTQGFVFRRVSMVCNAPEALAVWPHVFTVRHVMQTVMILENDRGVLDIPKFVTGIKSSWNGKVRNWLERGGFFHIAFITLAQYIKTLYFCSLESKATWIKS